MTYWLSFSDDLYNLRQMQAMTRKQREVANRHALFLDIARNVLHEEGFHLLSMERVAECAEYSKGTVYQHFSCKEEMLIQLCITSTTQLLALFQRAAGFDGSHRDRMMAVMHAHDLWATALAGELPQSELTVSELVFAMWSLSYGGQLLCSYDLDLAGIGVPDPNGALTRCCAAALDGLGWQPLFDAAAHTELQNRLRTELFADEHRQLTECQAAGAHQNG